MRFVWLRLADQTKIPGVGRVTFSKCPTPRLSVVAVIGRNGLTDTLDILLGIIWQGLNGLCRLRSIVY